jgi:hypothetical protein
VVGNGKQGQREQASGLENILGTRGEEERGKRMVNEEMGILVVDMPLSIDRRRAMQDERRLVCCPNEDSCRSLGPLIPDTIAGGME